MPPNALSNAHKSLWRMVVALQYSEAVQTGFEGFRTVASKICDKVISVLRDPAEKRSTILFGFQMAACSICAVSTFVFAGAAVVLPTLYGMDGLPRPIFLAVAVLPGILIANLCAQAGRKVATFLTPDIEKQNAVYSSIFSAGITGASVPFINMVGHEKVTAFIAAGVAACSIIKSVQANLLASKTRYFRKNPFKVAKV